MFILSFVKSSAVSHILIPNKNGKYFRQTLEDAVVKTADIIAAPDIYTSSVPPPGSPQDSSGSETHDFDSTSFTLQATTNERWRAIRKVTRLSNVKSAASISSQARLPLTKDTARIILRSSPVQSVYGRLQQHRVLPRRREAARGEKQP